MDTANLHRLIHRIDELMPSDEPSNGMYMEYEEFKAHQRELDAVVQQFASEEGGRHSHANEAEVLAVAGVRASCTTGPYGLLRNWQNAARRKIREAATRRQIDEAQGRCADDPINLAGSGPVPIVPREG